MASQQQQLVDRQVEFLGDDQRDGQPDAVEPVVGWFPRDGLVDPVVGEDAGGLLGEEGLDVGALPPGRALRLAA
ncbi:hypothetical protein [Streptomyces sp. NPDC054783]